MPNVPCRKASLLVSHVGASYTRSPFARTMRAGPECAALFEAHSTLESAGLALCAMEGVETGPSHRMRGACAQNSPGRCGNKEGGRHLLPYTVVVGIVDVLQQPAASLWVVSESGVEVCNVL